MASDEQIKANQENSKLSSGPTSPSGLKKSSQNATKHGFDVLYGQREDLPAGSLPRLICTKELRDYWEAHKATFDAAPYDLPIGRSTIKRARKKLGFHHGKDVSKFWMDRMHDLRTMKASEFAAKHNPTVRLTFEVRRRLLGRTSRQLGWWKTPACWGSA